MSAPIRRRANDYPVGDPVRDECVNCGQPVDSRKQMWKLVGNDVAHMNCPKISRLESGTPS